ncbi:MAG: VPLPA-CTERM sorting domain-containing protein [Chromatiales bacterium]|nr:VPLPA-CTERM sorting domain-containing protein [Chromatiales bacterium]
MMRTTSASAIIGASFVLLAGTAQAATVQDVAINGDFEAGLDGWLQFPSGGTIGIAADNGPSGPGSQSAQLIADGSGGPSFPQIKLERLAPGLLFPGADVTVQYDARSPLQTQNINAGDFVGNVVFIAELFSEFAQDGATNEILQGPPNWLTEDWQTFTFTTTLGPDVAGGLSLLFKADCGANPDCRFTALIDNVSITTAVVPIPAAMWLFGSALGLMAFMRRRAAVA